MLWLPRIDFQQPVCLANAATVTLQEHGATPEWAQPGAPVDDPQPVVGRDRVAQLHSLAGFAGHGSRSVAGRVTDYSTALRARRRVSSRRKSPHRAA
ncbi:hypothetical protein PUN4_1680007 [Paraburkholderia unamae]|nr:hypothetical protein PUN4_1680007 [Paraburkholderia unamae]